MRENTIFSLEHPLVDGQRPHVVHVRVDSCASAKIIELRYALLAAMHSGVELLWLADGRCPLVVIEAQDIVLHTISVTQGDMARFRLSRCPQVCASHILLILGRGDHCIVHILEGLRHRRRLAADVVGGIPWEGLSLEAQLVSPQRCVVIESEPVCVLLATEGNLTFRNFDSIVVPRQAQSVAADIDIPRRISLNKVCVIAHGINTSSLDSRVWEATIRPDRFRLCSCC